MKSLMTPTDIENQRILEEHRFAIELIAETDELQAAINYANSLIDTSAGSVGGDGQYWQRNGFPE